MKVLRILVGLILLAAIVTFAADKPAKGARVDVDAVEVPEKILVKPTSAEIHEEYTATRTCASCHTQSSLDAEPKPTNHFMTTKDCDKCHFSTSWVPLRIYSHLSGKYNRQNRNPQDCTECHSSNNEFIAR